MPHSTPEETLKAAITAEIEAFTEFACLRCSPPQRKDMLQCFLGGAVSMMNIMMEQVDALEALDDPQAICLIIEGLIIDVRKNKFEEKAKNPLIIVPK